MSFLKKKAFQSRIVKTRSLTSSEKKEAGELIGDATNGGRDIIRFMVNCMEARVEGVTAAAQVAAATWLGNYLFGKPVETTLQLSMSKTHDTLPGLTDEQLEDVLRGGLSQRLFGGNTPAGDEVDVRRDTECVELPGDADVAVPEVLPEVLQSGSVEGVPGAEDVPEDSDGQADGTETHEDDQ